MSKHASQIKAMILLPAIFLILLLIVPTFITNNVTNAAPQQTVVRCEPKAIVSDFTTPVSFTIYVENVADLNAADVQMSFDTTIAQVVDADANVPSTQIEILDEFLKPDFVVRQVADNTAGTIWYANTQVNPTPPVSGSGALARVTLQPQKVGTFKLHFTSQTLVMQNSLEIPSVAHDCEVSFFDPDNLKFIYIAAIFKN